VVIENATRDNERIRKVEDVEGDHLPYFTTILIYAGGRLGETSYRHSGVSALPSSPKAQGRHERRNPHTRLRQRWRCFTKATAHLAELFQQGRTIIGLCASGILIRSLAPHLSDKRIEPPVIAVAEDGASRASAAIMEPIRSHEKLWQ
jgi:hypothetical protein